MRFYVGPGFHNDTDEWRRGGKEKEGKVLSLDRDSRRDTRITMDGDTIFWTVVTMICVPLMLLGVVLLAMELYMQFQ